MRWGRAAALLCVLLQVDACSLLFVTPAPPFAQMGQPVECTDSHTMPWIDTIYGLALISSAVGGGTSSSPSSTDKSIGVPLVSLTGLAFLASAYIGFRRTGRCAELEDAYAAAHPYPPQPYYGQPQQPYYPQQPQQPYYPQQPQPQQPQPPPPAPSPPR